MMKLIELALHFSSVKGKDFVAKPETPNNVPNFGGNWMHIECTNWMQIEHPILNCEYDTMFAVIVDN